MKVIVGLGNPGPQFENTRHNVGFMVIDRLASNLKMNSFERKWNGMVAVKSLNGENIFLVKPTTYMNLSGKCVKTIINNILVDFQDILIVLDDVELPLGTIRIRRCGSSGGHKGLQSIIEECGTENIPRLRIGIGKSIGDFELAEYVLSPFESNEREVIEIVIDRVVDAVLCWYFEGIDSAMSKFNRSFLLNLEENVKDKEEKNER
ncbi:MAG: aminoacyl-tRNA hydrolase [Candidatus Hydrogenedentes bacterium]|nr:aminoacyl-tRNA hydrolase [Candidatus Hydrogenedentota bacterium]